MKFKKLIPYILVFLASFIITPVAITVFVKNLNLLHQICQMEYIKESLKPLK